MKPFSDDLPIVSIAERLCADQVERWQRGDRVPVEAYLLRHPELHDEADALFELILSEVVLRQEYGEPVAYEGYAWRFPRFADRLHRHFALHQTLAATRTLCPSDAKERILPMDQNSAMEGLPSLPGFELLGLLGSGAMGEVYRARQVSLNRLVALKMILAGRTGPSERERFRIEAEVLARLQHPYIVQIYDIGVHEDRPYLVCELVEGGSLADQLRSGPLPIRTAALLVEAVAGAIHHAHERGIVHRDLKPANILLAEVGLRLTDSLVRLKHPVLPGSVPKITDFGLAKLLDHPVGQTQLGEVVGTPAYMAPEQAAGSQHAVGAAADIYALGAVLYETLTGRPPFRGSTPLHTLLQVSTADPVPPSRLQAGLPRDLETICLKCLEKDPARRYPTALALADDLARWRQGKPIRARPTSPLEHAWRWARRHPAVAGFAITCISAVLFTLFTLLRSNARIAQQQAMTVAALHRERQARAEREAAEERKDQAVYLERINLAQRLWSANQTTRAAQLLALCPPHRRGWEWHYLMSLRQAQVMTLSGHELDISCLAYSADGQLLASADQAGRVHLWDSRTGRERIHWRAKERIIGLAFAPDGTRLATAGATGVQVWEVATGRNVLNLRGRTWVAFSPVGNYLASAMGLVIKLWDARTGRELRRLAGHEDVVHCGAFRPGLTHLATSSVDRTVRIWDVATGQAILPPRSVPAPVSALAYSVDGNYLVEERPGMVARFEAATGKLRGTLPLPPRGMGHFAVGPDGQQLAYSASDQTVRVYDLEARRDVLTLRGHTGALASVAFHPQGRYVAAGGAERAVHVWELSRAADVRILARGRSPVRGLAFGPEERLAVSRELAAGEAGVLLLDGATGRTLRQLPGRGGVAFSPDGRWLATSYQGAFRLWDTATGQEIRSLSGASGSPSRFLVSSDGRYLAATSPGRPVRVWDLNQKESRPQLLRAPGLVGTCALSPDGGVVAAADYQGLVYLWDTATGRQIRTLKEASHAVALAFSPDGALLAVAGTGRAIQLWDVASGEVLRSMHGHASTVLDVAFSPRGKRLVSGGLDGTVRLWDVASGVELLSLFGVQGEVSRVAFSPDGRCIAAADPDVKLWQVPGASPTCP